MRKAEAEVVDFGAAEAIDSREAEIEAVDSGEANAEAVDL